MSAFVVSKKTMDFVVAALIRSPYGSHKDFVLDTYTWEKPGKPYGPDVIGQRLWQMNVDAVNAAYPNNKDETDVRVYRFEPVDIRNPWQLLKCLQCFLYQCCEGNIPERREYKEVEEAIAGYKDYCLGLVPEYKAASWGVED